MIRVAKIINTRGLKGECKLYLYTDEEDLRFTKGSVLMADEKTPLTVRSFSKYKGFGYVYFEEITSIEQAEQFKNQILYISEDELPELEDGEYYYHQLQGCKVMNEQGEETGTVCDILETGANLVLRVRSKQKEYLLPFVNAFVQSVDPKEKVIVIKEMEGLR